MSDFFPSPGSIPPEVKEIIKNSSEDEVTEIMLINLKMALENPDELKKVMPGVPTQALAAMKFFPRTDQTLRPMAKVMAQMLIQQVKYGKQPTTEEVTKAVSNALMGSGAFPGITPEGVKDAMQKGFPGGLGEMGMSESVPGFTPVSVPATSASAEPPSTLPRDVYTEYQKLMASGKNRLAEQDYLAAEGTFKNAVALVEPHQTEGQELFSALQHLSIVQLEEENFADAEAVLRRWLKIGERIYSPEHQLLAGAYLGLGRVRESEKKMTDAELLYNRALSIAEASKDIDTESYISTLESVAYFYDSRKRYKKSDSLFDTVYSLKKDLYGEESMEVSEYEVQYASVLNDRENFEKALEWCKKAYATQLEITDPTDPDVLQTRLVLAEILASKGDTADARKELTELLSIFEDNGDEDEAEQAKEMLAELDEPSAGKDETTNGGAENDESKEESEKASTTTSNAES
ncbi:MAG: tetratricopeptide repeat protein [Cyanobacteria bacterium]|nr:tetratricopeptide repeat protein [Cyanobacteriota bacterium]